MDESNVMHPVGLILGLALSCPSCESAFGGGVKVTTFTPIPAGLAEGMNSVVAPVLEDWMAAR